MNRYLLYWWAGFWLQVLGIVTAIKFGIFQQIFGVDYTHITILIFSLHCLATGAIGWHIWRKSQPFFDFLWYMAETQLSLGMIGTLVGFIIMFTLFQHMGAVDINGIKDGIAAIGTGMGIAIRATLLGITSSVLLKAQILFLEKHLEK